MSHEKILILDLGSQYTQLIARRIREQGVFSEIVRYDISADEVRRHAPTGLVLSGGPASVYQEQAPTLDAGIPALDLPMLGLSLASSFFSRGSFSALASSSLILLFATEWAVTSPA